MLHLSRIFSVTYFLFIFNQFLFLSVVFSIFID